MEACDKYGRNNFRVGMGAEAILELLKAIDLEKDSLELVFPGGHYQSKHRLPLAAFSFHYEQ